ncbi:hypothetical protein [Embleya sp. NPDC005971]|uniref:hypothetical protein n=1 Tax=Embleya sp. NPDC005971 TaxID=3156724 RepID=UPI0033D5BF0C
MARIHQLPTTTAPTFDHAAAAFLAAHTAGPGARSMGTAKKYRETFTALGATPDSAAAASIALLDGPAGAAGGVHHPGSGDLRPAPVRTALGHRLVAGRRMGHR